MELPDVPVGGHIYAMAVQRLGWLDHSGLQSSPLTFTEIVHGCPWANEQDRDVIRAMSAAYYRGISMTDPFAKSPMDR